MLSHWQLDSDEFEESFASCSLNPKIFNHEAHLRLGYIHIKKYGLSRAIENVCEQIKRFDYERGRGIKFNKTVTIASVYIINHFISISQSNSFSGMLEEHPRLLSDFDELIGCHYSEDIFTVPEAKYNFLKPDLVAFV